MTPQEHANELLREFQMEREDMAVQVADRLVGDLERTIDNLFFAERDPATRETIAGQRESIRDQRRRLEELDIILGMSFTAQAAE